MKHVAVLIPCFNESQTIEKVVNDFTFYLDEHRQTKPFTYTIYVYDNNSTDQTAEIAAAAGQM